MSIMEHFGAATGLKINASKSTVAPIRCQDLDLDDILSPFAGQRATFSMTYLGLTLTIRRLRLVDLQPIQDKAKAKMAGWQSKLLNIAGRKELVRSVLSALPTYFMTALKVPNKFIKDLDKHRKNFLLAGSEELPCKISWLKVTRPVNYGGLGLHNLKCFSRALRLRWLWYEWHPTPKPCLGMELPIDDLDGDMFAAATVVMVNNGNKANF